MVCQLRPFVKMLLGNSTGLLVKSILVPESPERGPLIYIKSDILLPLKMDKLSNACTPRSHADTVFFSVSSFPRHLGKTTRDPA